MEGDAIMGLPVLSIKSILGGSGSGGGVSDYDSLTGKPQINGVTLSGDKTGQDYELYKVIASENHTTIEGYYVPVLTTEQITEAYNYIVAGKHVVINDAFDYIYLSVEEATNVGGDITIKVLFRDALILTYKLDGTIDATPIGIGETTSFEFTFTDGSTANYKLINGEE